jgi:hypothetical protein
VRLIHLDEAGTSKHENVCVVAGVMSDADEQWVPLNSRLSVLIEEYFPKEKRNGAVFHCKDIWHGSGQFHRDVWPREKRLSLLGKLAMIPSEFSLPIVSGVIDKREQSWDCKQGTAKWEAHSYSLAFGLCAVHAEYVMHENHAGEIAMIIAEDVPPMRRYAQSGYQILTDPRHPWEGIKDVVNYMPIAQIVEQPLFSAKGQSSILQIADCIAFILGRIMNGKTDIMPWFEKFKDNLVILPHQR